MLGRGHFTFIKVIGAAPASSFLVLSFCLNSDQGSFGLLYFEEEYVICEVFLG